MHYKPCYGCHLRAGCEVKAAMAKAIKGLGLRSIDWLCETKIASVTPGAIVRLTVPYVAMDSWGDDHVERDPVCGVVMRWKDDRKVWVYVAPGQSENVKSEMMARYPNRLTFLDEPPVRVCARCGKPEGVETIHLRPEPGDDGRCWECESEWDDDGNKTVLPCVYEAPR